MLDEKNAAKDVFLYYPVSKKLDINFKILAYEDS